MRKGRQLCAAGTVASSAALLGCSEWGEPASGKTGAPVGSSGAGEPAEASKPAELPPERAVLRIATYNINFANRRLDAVVDAIRRADADVVWLQETNDESAAVLRREFAGRYPHIRFYGSVRPYAAGGFALLSAFPLKREKFMPAEHGLFGICTVEVQCGRREIQMLCVHLQPVLIPRGGGSVLSVLQAFEAAEQTHRRETAEVLRHVRQDVPVAIVGDFNSGSTSHVPMRLTESGFTDSFAAANESPDDYPTWRWPTQFGHAELRNRLHFPLLPSAHAQQSNHPNGRVGPLPRVQRTGVLIAHQPSQDAR